MSCARAAQVVELLAGPSGILHAEHGATHHAWLQDTDQCSEPSICRVLVRYLPPPFPLPPANAPPPSSMETSPPAGCW